MADPEASVAGKRCLVVDDEFLIALDLQHILENAGVASVHCFANAAEALVALHGMPFDVAVLDVLLNDETSSLAVAEALTGRGIPFVFLTGMLGKTPQLARFPDVAAVLKPYTEACVLEALTHALQKSAPAK